MIFGLFVPKLTGYCLIIKILSTGFQTQIIQLFQFDKSQHFYIIGLPKMSEGSKQVIAGKIQFQHLGNSQQIQDKPEGQANEKSQEVNESRLNEEIKQLDRQSEQDNQRQQQREIDGVTIFCRICQDFIAHSVTTACQHTFCELCLTQYMLYIDQCPQCGSRIRHQRLSNNILLDNLIMDYVKKYEPDDLQIIKERVEKFKINQRDKKLAQFQTGMKVDVRDSDYVWCTGRIYRTVNKFQQKKVKCMTVKYDKSNKKQEFPENSSRVAPLGFYTGRKDIPRYNRGKLILQDQQQNVVYSIPNYYDDEEQKQKQKQ